jgi:hypothetical protein
MTMMAVFTIFLLQSSRSFLTTDERSEPGQSRSTVNSNVNTTSGWSSEKLKMPIFQMAYKNKPTV